MAALQEPRSFVQECQVPYDTDAFDSMATINSELWNEGNADELEPFTIPQEILKGDVPFDSACECFLTAAQKGSTDGLKTLLKLFGKELISFKDEDGYTALHRASYNGHRNVVEFLLTHGADFDIRTEDGWQPLHCACKWNKVKVASLLIQNGAKINAGTNGGQTPLHLAATNEKGRATLELLLHRHDIDATLKNGANETAYDVAARYGPYAELFEVVHDSLNTV